MVLVPIQEIQKKYNVKKEVKKYVKKLSNNCYENDFKGKPF